MKRTGFLFILICVLCASNLSAQEVIYSPYEKFEFRNGDFSVVGKCAKKLYTYRSSADGFFLDAYDDSMIRQATVILDFFPKKIYETRFIAYTDQILVLYQAVEGTKVIQYAALLDENGRLKKQPIKIDEVKTGFFGPNKDYFSSVVSDDRKTIVVYSAVSKNEALQFSGIWLDNQLNVTARKQTMFNADNYVTATCEPLVSADGSLYIAVSTPVGSRDYADQLWLLTMPAGESAFHGTEFLLESKFVTGAYIRQDNINNRIYIGGFYSEKKSGNYDGVLFGHYDIATKTFAGHKLIAFDDQLRNISGERSRKRAFNDYEVRQLIVRNDGGFVLISENFYITTRNTGYAPGWGYYSAYSYGPYSSPSIREYHYNDIMLLSYNAEGAREWQSFIRKDQYSQEDGGIFSSYALVNTGGTLGLLFNDYNTNRSRIQLGSVDDKGNVSMQAMSAGAEDPDWMPRSAKQVASKELIIPCVKKRQLCFAKVVF